MNLEEQKRIIEYLQSFKTELLTLIVEKMSEPNEENYIWIDTKTTMKMLSIKSPTTLQKLRNTGAIEFSQPMRKVVLYKKKSVLQYLEKHSRKAW